MKKIPYLFLLAMMSACASAATVVPPHNTLEWTNPTLNADGSPLTDLVSVTFTCGGVPFTVPTTAPGASLSEPLPAGVLALSGAVSCTGIATSTSGGDSIIPSNNSDRWCDGVSCYDTQPAYCAGGACYDAVPPDPPTLGDGGQAGTSALALAAAGLSPGQTVLFGQAPFLDPTAEDLKWQSVTYRDAVHGRILLMGKKPGGTSPHWWSIYDEASDTWSAPQTLVVSTGHIYGGITVDQATGDFYFKEYGPKSVHILDAATLTWSNTSTWVIANTSTTPHSSVVWHPNLYGVGDGGLVLDAGYGTQPVIGWRKSTDTWAIIASGGSPGRTGQGAYFAALDIAVSGGSDNAGNAGILVSPGPIAAAGATFPLRIAGDTFGNTSIGAMMQSPTDPAKLWIVQNGDTVNDGRRVYESTDAVTWTQIADHPFIVAEGGIWVSMPAYGVVGFIDANDGAFWLWKP